MANLYDIKEFDLNLLVIFECIYQHLSITKAAETLYITPSAVSQSLQRLRTQFNDPLFIRSGKGLTPTIMGINLHHHLEKNLNSLEQTINIMNNSSLKKKFIIYCPQLPTIINIEEVIHFLREDSHVEIEHHNILITAESTENLLAYRKADLVIATAPVSNRSIICSPFKTAETILVCNKNHPRINGESTLETILKEQFTQLISEDPGVKEYWQKTSALLANRDIGFRSDSLITIINIISNTDIIGLLPRDVYEQYTGSFNLKEICIDIPLPKINLFLMYNRASLNNTGFVNLINKINDKNDQRTNK